MSVIKDWNRFWFSPFSPAPLGLFRVIFGALVVIYALMLFPDRDLWFSDRGILTTQMSDMYDVASTPGPRPVNLLHGYVSSAWVTTFFVAFIFFAFCLMIGLFTRTSTILVWIGVNSLHNRDSVINNSGDTIMLVMVFLLIFASAGSACSVDRLIRIMRGREDDLPPKINPWAMRLMQLQLTTVYLCTVLSKFQGAMWQNGTAVYYSTRLPELARFPATPLTHGPLWLINVFTYGTLCIELAMATLIWIPRFRLYVLAAGLILHAGIEYSMNIPLFAALIVSCYTLFLTDTDLKRFVARVHRGLQSERLRLVFDGECDFCRSVLLIVKYCDAFRLITFLDYHDPVALQQAPTVRFEDADNSAIAVDQNGKEHVGFYAFRQIAWRLPAFWLAAPFLYIPGVPQLGQRTYKWIAVNRSRLPVAPRFAVKSADTPLPAIGKMRNK